MYIIPSFVLSSQPEILQYFLIFPNYETGDSYKSVLLNKKRAFGSPEQHLEHCCTRFMLCFNPLRKPKRRVETDSVYVGKDVITS